MLRFECGICVFVRSKRDVCYTGESLIWLFRFFAGVLFAPCCAIFRGKRVHLGLLCGGGMDPAPLFVLWVLLLVLCVHCTFVLPLSNAERTQSAEGREAQIPRDQKGKNSITRLGNWVLLWKGYKKDIFDKVLTGFELSRSSIILFLCEFRPEEL